MVGWKYRLEFEGKYLRELLNKDQTIETVIAVYKQIIMCLEHLKNRLSSSDKEDMEYDIDCMIDDLKCACPEEGDNELVYSEEEENLNYYLRDFYDFCDSSRVWIGV